MRSIWKNSPLEKKTSQFCQKSFKISTDPGFQQLSSSINGSQFACKLLFSRCRYDWLRLSLFRIRLWAQIANTQSTILLSPLALAISWELGINTVNDYFQPILQLNQASSASAAGSLSQAVTESPCSRVNHAVLLTAGSIKLQESFNTLEQANEQLEHRAEGNHGRAKSGKDKLKLLSENYNCPD